MDRTRQGGIVTAAGVVVSLLGLAGCSGSPTPVPTAASPTTASPTVSATCAVAAVELGARQAGALRFTAVIGRTSTAAGVTEVEFVADPFVPYVTVADDVDPAAVTAKIADDPDAPTLETRDNHDRVEALVRSVDSTNGLVAYAAATLTTTPLTVRCADGRELPGSVHSWDTPETGVITCATTPPDTAAKPARQAHQEFCPQL